MRKKYKILFLSFCLATAVVLSSSMEDKIPIKKNEAYYQVQFCEKVNGVTEFILPDRTRVDCLTDEYAIEVDWAKKWAESIGQSLFYADMTDKKAGVALIVGENDNRYLKRINRISKKVNIKIFIIKK
ncbi:MAG: hypothetical protein RQ936_02275 [Gammaproteobacteria bacterium]|nr:hypothetical protein [Gammaproteobacteria bacterium]